MRHHQRSPLTHGLLVAATVVAVFGATGRARAAEARPAATPAETPAPKGSWQPPGEIQQPKGTWQVPGAIQKPGEIQRIVERCRQRLVVAADALFAFDQATLSPQAEQTLAGLGPELTKEKGKVTVEGHTDAKGTDDYNRKLSERRAAAVRDWLVAHRFAAAGTPVVGYGSSKPVAPNRQADGSDDPAGRAKNRRVEVVVESCPTEEHAPGR
jgi:outer membrane protein OmpA-like peptidoglycan-associated protein